MISLNAFLLILALVLFMLAGLGIGGPRLNLGWYGLACVTLAVLLTGGI